MTSFTETLRARLRDLGMHFDGEQMDRAEAIVKNHTEAPHVIDDTNLMTIAVEAYRRPEAPVREIV